MSLTVAPKWLEKRDELCDLILREGWLLTDIAEYYGVSNYYAGEIVRACGVPYSHAKTVALWCPWQPRLREKPCTECGKPTMPHHRWHGRCVACDGRRRYREDPQYAANIRSWSAIYRAADPEKCRQVQRRASARYRAKKVAAGQCQRCDQPIDPGNKYFCAAHREANRVRYHASKQQAAA